MKLIFNDSVAINCRLELSFFQTNKSHEAILICIEDESGRLAVNLEPDEAEKLAEVLLAYCNEKPGHKLLYNSIFDDNG